MPVDARAHELLKVYVAVPVLVTLLDDLVPVDVVLIFQGGVRHRLQFVLRQCARLFLVEANELPLQSM